MSLTLKSIGFYRFSESYKKYLIAIICYFFCFFFIHEYTQIRASLSMAIFLNALPSLRDRKFLAYYLICAVAVMAHFSALVCFIFPLFFIIKNDKFYIYFPIVGFLIAAVTYVFKIDVIQDLALKMIGLSGFKKGDGLLTRMNPFNLKYLALLAMFTIYSFSIVKKEDDKTNIFLMKVLSCGLCFFYFLNPLSLPILSVRFAEYFSFVFVIYFANCYDKITILKERWMSFAILSIFTLLYCYATLKTTAIIS